MFDYHSVLSTLGTLLLLWLFFGPSISIGGSGFVGDADEESASAGLKLLAQTIIDGQKAFDTAPQVHLASWHLDLARDCFTQAQSALSNDEDYDQSVLKSGEGNFHARLACDLVAEYRFHFERLVNRPAAANVLDTPVVHDQVPLVGITPIAPIKPPGVTETAPLVETDSPPATAPGATQPAETTNARIETVNAPVETVVTAPALPLVGAQDRASPDYCSVSDSDIEEILPTWRKLALLIVRNQAVIDAKIRVQYPQFNDADLYLGYANTAFHAANDADWSDVAAILEDGLFFARLSQKVALQILAAHDVTVVFPSVKWDTSDDSDGDGEEAYDAATDMALAVAAARVSLAKHDHQPWVAEYHLGLAQAFLTSVCADLRNCDWDEAKESGLKGTFHGRLACESVAAYEQECLALSQGRASTIEVAPKSPSPNYLYSEDDDQDAGWEAWRTLTLKVAKLQALLDTKCAGFADGPSQLKSAQAFVERAEATRDWEDVPAVAEAGEVFIAIAAEAARKFAA